MRVILALISVLVPGNARTRWREEWRAELQHGRWTMVFGALPDAWALRRLPREARGQRAGIFHALDQDVRYALRSLGNGRSFTVAVIGSLAIGIGATTTAFALVNASLLTPFPALEDEDTLVRISVGPQKRLFFSTTWDEYKFLEKD